METVGGEVREPSARERFAEFCYLQGITDKGVVARLWTIEKAKRKKS